MADSTIGVIIINYNNRNDTMECLASLQSAGAAGCRILVVDNGSTDGSVENIRKEYPGINVLENRRNCGFAEGNNIGISWVRDNWDPEYYLLLNNDTIVEKGCIEQMIECMSGDTRIGATGPRILCYPDRERIWSAGGIVKISRAWAKNRGQDEINNGQYNIREEVDFISGCAMLIRSNVIIKDHVKFFKNYFLYFEDVDFCMKVKEKGYKIVYVPEAVLYHKASATSGGQYGSLQSFYRLRNRLIFAGRNMRSAEYVVFLTLGMPLLILRDVFVYLKKGRYKELSKVIHGVLDYFYDGSMADSNHARGD